MAIPPSENKPEAVSDTGPFISLEKLPNGFSTILKALFRRVLIPPEVLHELQAGSTGSDYLRDHGLEDFVQVLAGDGSWDSPGARDLDPGERAAIDLALTKGHHLLIEERLGRKLALEAGVPVIGAAGLIRIAHEKGALSLGGAEEALRQLHRAGRIGKQLLTSILADLGVS